MGMPTIEPGKIELPICLNNGISFQPMNGAPYYVLYNQVSVLNNQSVLKLRDRSDRALIAHNTFVCNSGPMASGSNYLVNFEIKNNLWISVNDRYAWENGSKTPINWKTDFDYDGFDWQNYQYAFKWGDRLDDIVEFYDSTGQEAHGIKIDHESCFDSLDFREEMGNPGIVDSFYIQYYTLNAACNAVNAGIPLVNINDGFTGAAPDLGAYEVGNPLPHYGVRPFCAQVFTNTWQGSNGAFWHQDSNWSLNRIPTNCDHVLIQNGQLVKIAPGEIGLAFSIEVMGGGQIDIQSTAQLNIQMP